MSTGKLLTQAEFEDARRAGEGYVANLAGGWEGNVLHRAGCGALLAADAYTDRTYFGPTASPAVGDLDAWCGPVRWHTCARCWDEEQVEREEAYPVTARRRTLYASRDWGDAMDAAEEALGRMERERTAWYHEHPDPREDLAVGDAALAARAAEVRDLLWRARELASVFPHWDAVRQLTE